MRRQPFYLPLARSFPLSDKPCNSDGFSDSTCTCTKRRRRLRPMFRSGTLSAADQSAEQCACCGSDPNIDHITMPLIKVRPVICRRKVRATYFVCHATLVCAPAEVAAANGIITAIIAIITKLAIYFFIFFSPFLYLPRGTFLR